MKFITLLSLFIFVSTFINAQENKDDKKLNFHSDVRLRAELDRNSERSDGTLRDDRDRFRYRFRLGIKYSLNQYFEFGGQMRSGNSINQQSPHVTLGKEFQPDEISIDRAYIKVYSNKGLWAWIGKNSIAFWHQNELLWDEDVNPEGISIGTKLSLNNDSYFEPVFGYFIAGHSDNNFNDNSHITIAQLKLSTKLGENNLFISTGIINASDLPDRPDNTGEFQIDYNIWASSLQLNLKNTGLKFGLDYYNNLTDYKNDVNISDVYEDQTTGFVGSVIYDIKKIQFSYYYAHIEKYAVVDYYAQDDWVRWGNNNFTASSNFSGSEFRIKYDINNQFNIDLRAYLVEGIKTTGTNLETGTRIRLDFNINF